MRKSFSCLDRCFEVLLTVGWLGYLPWMPGTFGTLGGVGIYGLFIFLGLYSPWVMLGVAVLLTCVGGVLGGWMERRYSSSDPSCVVLDEVAGYLVSVVVFVEGFSPIWVGLVAFVLFRVLDIWKPPPVGWAERLSGGWGVMADDLCAGVMVSGGIHLFLWLM